MEPIADIHALIDKGQPDVALVMLWGDYNDAVASKRIDHVNEIAAAAQRVRSSPAATDAVKEDARVLLELIAAGRRVRATPTVREARPAPALRAGVSPVAVGLVLAGALATVIAVFLPKVESGTFFRVEKNSLIQQGDGWLFVVIALAAVGSLYRAYRSGKGGWGLLIAGVVVIGAAIYYGTNKDQLTLCPVNPTAGLTTACEQANPGVGLYVAGVGGLLMLAGGIQLLRGDKEPHDDKEPGVGQSRPVSTSLRPLKRCPDCAEDVLAEARVCRYCGHSFASER